MAELLSGDVDVPGAGKVKKAYILVPAGLAAVYVAWRWYQAGQGAEAPAGSDGLYTSDDLSEYGLSTTGGGSTVTGNTGSQQTDATTPGAIDDNADWANAAVERLTNEGYDAAVVRNALGEFLARRALDRTEATIARAAMSAAGQPPEGRPWSVIEEAATDSGTPAAPANLRAWNSPNTSTRIGLQWDPVPGALHYRIFRADLGEEPIGDSVDTKFNAGGLQPNTSYSFFVRAVSTTNKVGARSNTFAAKTAPVALGKPTGLKASAITRTSFRVSVTPVKGATYYRWYVNGRGVTPSDRPYQDFTGMRPNTSYRVQCVADTTNQSPGPISDPITVRTKK